MAPMYATAEDLEALLRPQAPRSPPGAPWVAFAACLLGLACTAMLVLQPQTRLSAAPPRPAPSTLTSLRPAQQQMVAAPAPGVLQKVGSGLAAFSLSALATLNAPGLLPAMASEADVLATPTPASEYLFDDGAVLSKATLGELANKLPEIESRTGYHINVVTLRKLISFDDAFQFADNLIESWYPTAELGDKKAVFVVVKGSKEGALVGGPSFSSKVPSSVLESIITENVGKLAAEEKFNQAVISTINRLDALLSGLSDPGAPKSLFEKGPPKSQTYKTKEETDSKRSLYTAIFGGLVAISFIAPMVQFFGYTKDDE